MSIDNQYSMLIGSLILFSQVGDLSRGSASSIKADRGRAVSETNGRIEELPVFV